MADDAGPLPDDAEAILLASDPEGINWDAQAQSIERRILGAVPDDPPEIALLQAPRFSLEPNEPPVAPAPAPSKAADTPPPARKRSTAAAFVAGAISASAVTAASLWLIAPPLLRQPRGPSTIATESGAPSSTSSTDAHLMTSEERDLTQRSAASPMAEFEPAPVPDQLPRPDPAPNLHRAAPAERSSEGRRVASRAIPARAPEEAIVLEETASPTDSREDPPEPKLRIASGSAPTVAEQPSPGAVQAALHDPLTRARACVAGFDAPSTASVVFLSDGSVSGVTVGGRAAGTPAARCIESSLRRARITPFAKPSFGVNGIPIRP